MSNLLTVIEIAKKLRVDAVTVRRWIRNGTLPALELPGKGNRVVYRVKQKDLDKILGA